MPMPLTTVNAERFEIENVPCKAYLPESGNVNRAILAVHGFASSKDSVANRALVSAQCPNGAVVYCFDFPAHGDHPAGGEALTLSACSDALLSVARRMQEKHPSARKSVFGSSFGGYMTLFCLGELTGILDDPVLAFKAPAVKMAKTFEHVIVGNRMGLLERQGFIELGFQRKMNVRREFLDELKEHDVCKPFDKPMLVVHGDKDKVVLPADIDEFMAANPLAELVRIPGADHDFKGRGQLDAVIEAAGKWLA